MKNADIFRDYDMVVAVTQETINLQLRHLVKLGTIRSEFILYQAIDDAGDFVFTIHEKWETVPKDANGIPQGACVRGSMMPQVNISASGQNITLVLDFSKGTAYFWVGQGPKAKLRQFDMKGWKYGVSITLDLAQVEKDAIGKSIAVPPLVERQLKQFVDDMFRVSSLFMDFNSTDLLRFDPAHTAAAGAPDIGMQQFVEFMNFYLTKTVKDGNPYILGYTIQTTPQQPSARTQQVPESLRPAGTTFNLFRDSTSANRSTLNFILATLGGHRQISGTPGLFDTNWIAPTDQCDAMLIYSRACILETLILKPLFEQFSQKCHDGIKNSINVPQGNTYDQGKTVVAGGMDFVISNVSTGNDQYVNTYKMRTAVDRENHQVDLNLTGDLLLYKEIKKKQDVCTAEAWARGTLKWKATISLAVTKDAQGNPELTTATSFEIVTSEQNSDQNDCAKFYSWIANALGSVLEFFGSIFGQNLPSGVLQRVLEMVMSAPVPGIGDLSTALGNLPNSFGTMFMLPAGDVFFFKKPDCDAESNVSIQLTYKADN